MNKILILSICLLFAACQQENIENSRTTFEAGIPVEVSLSVIRQQPVLALDSLPVTRSGEPAPEFEVNFTDSGSGIATRAVSQFTNTWLLQFNAAGNCVTCTNIGTISAGGILTARLSAGTNTTLYLLGNGPAALTRPATLNDFEGSAYFSADTYGDPDALPYISKVTGVSVSATGKLSTTDGNDAAFRMKRIAARLSLTCTTTLANYRITGVALYNAPQKMYYAYTNRTAEVQSTPLTAHQISGNTYTWFIGENLRGNGSSTNQRERYAAKAPVSSCFIRITAESLAGCESTTYDIYPGKDLAANYDLARNWDYTYTTVLTKAGADVSADQRTQATGVPIDLTAQPSNCYVVEPGKSYKFRINIKGEETAVVPAGMTLSKTNTVTNMALLWQDQPGLVASLNYIDPATAVVCFKQGTQGNAVIMAQNNGVTQWSWHFWVLQGGAGSLNWYTTNGIPAMDRNLGALVASRTDPGSVDYRGLIYEWGRKDPFPGAGSTNTNVRKTVYNSSGAVFITNRVISPVPLSTTTEHPDWYVYTNDFSGNVNNWLIPANDDLWGYTSNAKTIFDPCPSGWRVPLDHTVWNNWNTLNFSWNATYLCGRYATTMGGWFPAAGRYDYKNAPLTSVVGILEIGSQGYYWTSKPATDGKAGVFHFTDALLLNTVERIDVAQTYGCSIRPVKVR